MGRIINLLRSQVNADKIRDKNLCHSIILFFLNSSGTVYDGSDVYYIEPLENTVDGNHSWIKHLKNSTQFPLSKLLTWLLVQFIQPDDVTFGRWEWHFSGSRGACCQNAQF